MTAIAIDGTSLTRPHNHSIAVASLTTAALS